LYAFYRRFRIAHKYHLSVVEIFKHGVSLPRLSRSRQRSLGVSGGSCRFVSPGHNTALLFTISEGRWVRQSKFPSEQTGIRPNTNESWPGAASGHVDMGGSVGGRAQYVMVPYADFNLLRLRDRQQAMERSGI
jgi:hypothetical protein